MEKIYGKMTYVSIQRNPLVTQSVPKVGTEVLKPTLGTIGTVLHAAWVHFSYPQSGNIFVLRRRFCLLFQAMQIFVNVGYKKCALHKKDEIGISIMATIFARWNHILQ